MESMVRVDVVRHSLWNSRDWEIDGRTNLRGNEGRKIGGRGGI